MAGAARRYGRGVFGGLFKTKSREYPAPVAQLKASLWVIQGARLGEHWSLDEGDLTVGRLMTEEELAAAAGRSVSFPDHCKFISGHHAVFKRQDDGYWVYDLGSRNGTTLNGQRVEKGLLMHGDEVDIGQVVLRVHVEAPVSAEGQGACTVSAVSGPRQGSSWVLSREVGEVMVGRNLEGDQAKVISLPDSERDVSTEHAIFKRLKGSFWVQDLASKNGTFVNGQRVERQDLKDGDKVSIGVSTFEVRIAG